jgi:hypothetical protein
MDLREIGFGDVDWIHLSRIWGSHGGEYEDGCLLGCSTVLSGRSLPAFQRTLLPPSSRRWVKAYSHHLGFILLRIGTGGELWWTW